VRGGEEAQGSEARGRSPIEEGERGRSLAGLGAAQADPAQTRLDLERWRAGDSAAFGALWNRLQRPLRILVGRRLQAVGNPRLRTMLDHEDVLQETAAVVLRKLESFEYRGPGSLLAWLQSLALNIVQDRIDYWEAQKRSAAREVAASGQDDREETWLREPRDPSPGPATAAASVEQEHAIDALVAGLDERPFRLVMLKYFAGASWEAIAIDLGAESADSVRKEHARLLPKLRPRLRSP